jgi:hypothetical protein
MSIHMHDTFRSTGIEAQLVQLIEQSRLLAATAEEMLREITAAAEGGATPSPACAAHVASFAPRMLASTNDQLRTIVEMLRQADA